MIFFRTIPLLLIKDKQCVKKIKFKKEIYLGDIYNIVKIFNELNVDELIILDISRNLEIDFNFLRKISEESFVPLTYGGSINSSEKIEKIIQLGYERISLNNFLISNPIETKNIIKKYGSSSITLSVNLKKNIFGKYKIYDYKKKNYLNVDFMNYLEEIDQYNPSEILISFVDKEGTFSGFDFDLLYKIRKHLKSNLIVYGGLKSESEILKLKSLNYQGVCASRIFCFQKNLDSVLINYIEDDLKKKIYQ
jgi:imidazole glycerol-phosphate synthase subunit HisF